MRQNLRRFASGLRSQVLATLIPVIASACSSTGYAHDRLLDLSDVVDIEYGTGMGLGAMVQATLYLQAGLGFSETWTSREWYGRRPASLNGGVFVGFVVFTSTGYDVHGSPPMSSLGVLCVNVLAVFDDDDDPQVIDRFRFGGRVYLPGGHGGLFVNAGEIVDLFAGLVGFDPAGDDGVPKSGPLTD